MKRQRKEKDDSGFLPLSSPEGRPLVVSSLLFSVPSYGSLSFLGTFLLVSPLLSFLQETQWAERVFIWRRRGMLCLVLSSCTFPLPLGLYDRKGAGRQETRRSFLPPRRQTKTRLLYEKMLRPVLFLSQTLLSWSLDGSVWDWKVCERSEGKGSDQWLAISFSPMIA